MSDEIAVSARLLKESIQLESFLSTLLLDFSKGNILTSRLDPPPV